MKSNIKNGFSYNSYMKKFQANASCQCNVVDAKTLNPKKTDFSQFYILKNISKRRIAFFGHLSAFNGYYYQ